LRTHPERKHFIATLAATRPDDAHELLAVLFRAGVDGRVRDLIERELSDSRPEFWRALFESSLTSYRQNPDAFIWLAEHEKRRAVATARGVLSRLLDLLETDLHRTHWVRLRNVLVSADYRLLREALGELDEAEAERVAARLRRARTLEGFRADEMIAILAEKFPGLRARDDEDVVYTTATGLDKAKAELRHMTEVEIPKTAEEIARARAHGDLSENYEYKAAKEKQARLMARMKVLRDEIARAQVVGASDVDTSEVSFGCRVLVADSGGQASAYTILGPWDADPDAGVISMQSPLALLLLGRKPGESLDTGGRRLTITGIESAL
jgi:transcription elongation factor GreA